MGVFEKHFSAKSLTCGFPCPTRIEVGSALVGHFLSTIATVSESTPARFMSEAAFLKSSASTASASTLSTKAGFSRPGCLQSPFRPFFPKKPLGVSSAILAWAAPKSSVPPGGLTSWVPGISSAYGILHEQAANQAHLSPRRPRAGLEQESPRMDQPRGSIPRDEGTLEKHLPYQFQAPRHTRVQSSVGGSSRKAAHRPAGL